MKLELKHLAPYLPYGLKLLYENSKGEHIKLPLVTAHFTNEWTPNFHSKPILRPLSDLNKEGDNVFMQLQMEGGFVEDKIIKGSLVYSDVEILLKNHFDVFGLIPEGLAIDINTLEK